MKCSDCRQNEALDTRWERFKRWLMFHLFPVEVNNLSSEKYTQGFSDGYKRGYTHGHETVKPEDMFNLIEQDAKD